MKLKYWDVDEEDFPKRPTAEDLKNKPKKKIKRVKKSAQRCN